MAAAQSLASAASDQLDEEWCEEVLLELSCIASQAVQRTSSLAGLTGQSTSYAFLAVDMLVLCRSAWHVAGSCRLPAAATTPKHRGCSLSQVGTAGAVKHNGQLQHQTAAGCVPRQKQTILLSL